MTIKEEILYSIKHLIKKEMKQLKIGRDVSTVILDISADKYRVNIDGRDYWLKDGVGLDLSVGMSVWVRIVGGSEMYIASRK